MDSESLKRSWDDYAARTDSIWPSEHLVRFIRSNQLHTQKLRVLEIGPGSGRNSVYLASLGFDLTVIDISQEAIKKTLMALNSNGYKALGIVENILDCALEQFDIIIDISTLQHLRHSELITTIGKLHEILSVGGQFFSITKHRNDTTYQLGELVSNCEVYFKPGIPKVVYETHITYLDISEITSAYEQFDFMEVNYDEWTYGNMTSRNAHWMIHAKKLK